MVIKGKQVKEWVERAYNNAVKHGWHEEKKPTANILRELLRVNWQTSAFVYLTLWG